MSGTLNPTKFMIEPNLITRLPLGKRIKNPPESSGGETLAVILSQVFLEFPDCILFHAYGQKELFGL